MNRGVITISESGTVTLSAAARRRGVPLRRRGDLRRRRPAGRLRRDGQHRGRAGAQARAH